ncbi:Dephospho-CoA kinase [Corynebacterium capitovis DSM 44611]|uniref:dephospho-CoA kinase n=1 Tax=Corynebacterium capitovis TaxID=131081 RepID=UPI0003667D8A|nr:dephospho-CoA kinase [Corynebacterium capitovis]WKD57754.1 Dephospho-CoA kinase [Corynebacterium capitovis DSM 44611]
MLRVGLTGGIGSGKSTVARMLREAGIPVVDADAIAREIMEPGSHVLDRVAAEFGADLLDGGALNRSELARRAFTSPEATARLNAITHPAIRAESDRRFEELEAAGEAVAVYDMPLLLELGLDKAMDLTVIVEVEADERVRRLVQQRGMGEEDARNRIARQISDAERRARADIVIDNNGDVNALKAQVEGLVSRIKDF